MPGSIHLNTFPAVENSCDEREKTCGTDHMALLKKDQYPCCGSQALLPASPQPFAYNLKNLIQQRCCQEGSHMLNSQAKSPDYETSVDLWSDNIAMD